MQNTLFSNLKYTTPSKHSVSQWGTFRESLRAPIHRWFTYPAGFSYKAVQHAIESNNIKKGMKIYDPFTGTGTTNIVAKALGIDSYGVEAHSFVHQVAATKLYWEFDIKDLIVFKNDFISKLRSVSTESKIENTEIKLPELVLKCYSPYNLKQLLIIRNSIRDIDDPQIKNLFRLGLTNILRSAAEVETGWPYIAPKKAKNGNGKAKDVVSLYQKQINSMIDDLVAMKSESESGAKTELVLGDSRISQLNGNGSLIKDESFDLVFTSPPYLNNFDYADRTRLEMYFWEEASSWGDITKKVRDKLMMSATTQIRRNEYDMSDILDDDFVKTCPQAAKSLVLSIEKLSDLRTKKGGKKSYDILVAGYFNDMFNTMKETFRIMKPNSNFYLILGDSAPYGVYVPTHEYLGEIALGIGFKKYEVEILRERGGKWKANPQRHKVPLKEVVLSIQK